MLALSVAGVAVWLGSACGTNAAVVRFANEFSCPQDQVALEDLGAHTYRVTGCGRTATYICLSNASTQMQAICSLDAENPGPAQRTAGGSDDVPMRRTGPARALPGQLVIDGVEVPAIQIRLSGMPVLFAPQPGSDPPAFLVAMETSYAGQAERCSTLDLSGSGGRVSAEREPGEGVRFVVAGDTLRAITAGRSLELAACQRRLSLTRPQREVLATFVEHQLEADPSPAASAAEAAPASPGEAGEQSAQDQIRAELDRRRDVLFACVTQPVIGVRVRWDASGIVSVSLNGALAGNPEEACVRSQLQGLGVAEGTEAGEVVHVLSR